jgi:hypothetical protein
VSPTDLRMIRERYRVTRAALLEDDPVSPDARALALLGMLAESRLHAQDVVERDIVGRDVAAGESATCYAILAVADEDLREALGMSPAMDRVKLAISQMGAAMEPPPGWQGRVLAKAKGPWWRRTLRWLSW